jgi:enediyne biosynthesis protein E4
MRRAFFGIGCTFALLTGCGDDTTDVPPVEPQPQGPPPICRTPEPISWPWIREITGDVGLAPTADFAPVATGVVAGDLDGDGFDDLVATFFPSQRDGTGPRRRFVLMNRPGAGDARVLVDATAESGLLATRDGVNDRGFAITSLGDLDNDGDLDAILCPGSGEPDVVDGCTAFLNDATGHFVMAPPSDLDAEVFWVVGSVMLDYDLDGILDFWPSTVGAWSGPVLTSRPRLYRGNGDGTFTEVGAQVGLPQNLTAAGHYRIGFGIASCDLDSDGDRDVVVASYGRQPNLFWRNDGGHFVEDGVPLGIAYDDRMDYSDDQSYRCFCQATPGACDAAVPPPDNGVPCPLRGWQPGVSDQPENLGGNNFSVGCADVDDDGDMDLLTSTVRHGDVGSASDESEILFNVSAPGAALVPFERPGRAALGLVRDHQGIWWDEGDNMTLATDVDLDGRKDLWLFSSNYPGTGDHPWLWQQLEDGTYVQATAEGGAGHPSAEGPALFDLDGDGDLDMAAGSGTFNAAAPTNAVHAYANDAGQGSNWTSIRLVGLGAGGANRSGIGARVLVTAGGRTQVQEVAGSWGHSNTQSGVALVFGLGESCTMERVEVRWPNAAHDVTVIENAQPNYRIEITEGETAVRYIDVPEDAP